MRFSVAIISTFLSAAVFSQEATLKIAPNSPVEYDLKTNITFSQKTNQGTNKGTAFFNLIAASEVTAQDSNQNSDQNQDQIQDPAVWVITPSDFKLSLKAGGLKIDYDSTIDEKEKTAVESQIFQNFLKQSLRIPLTSDSESEITFKGKPLRDPKLENSLHQTAMYIKNLFEQGVTVKQGQTFVHDISTPPDSQGQAKMTVTKIDDDTVYFNFQSNHQHTNKHDESSSVVVTGKSQGEMQVDRKNALLVQIKTNGTMQIVEKAVNAEKNDPVLQHGDFTINVKVDLSSKSINVSSDSGE